MSSNNKSHKTIFPVSTKEQANVFYALSFGVRKISVYQSELDKLTLIGVSRSKYKRGVFTTGIETSVGRSKSELHLRNLKKKRNRSGFFGLSLCGQLVSPDGNTASVYLATQMDSKTLMMIEGADWKMSIKQMLSTAVCSTLMYEYTDKNQKICIRWDSYEAYKSKVKNIKTFLRLLLYSEIGKIKYPFVLNEVPCYFTDALILLVTCFYQSLTPYVDGNSVV